MLAIPLCLMERSLYCASKIVTLPYPGFISSKYDCLQAQCQASAVFLKALSVPSEA